MEFSYHNLIIKRHCIFSLQYKASKYYSLKTIRGIHGHFLSLLSHHMGDSDRQLDASANWNWSWGLSDECEVQTHLV